MSISHLSAVESFQSVVTIQSKIPIGVKLLFTLFLCVLVPYYWVTYTPWNFLYFCDIALFFTLVALWLESPILASIPTVGIILPQLLWVLDLITGASITGMTEYMFNPQIPLFVRGLSSFHGWLPFLLLWMVWRLGYDKRAFPIQVVSAWLVLLICYFLAPGPPPPTDNPSAAVNINYVYGLNDLKPQSWLAASSWFLVLMVVHPLVFHLPAHVALKGIMPAANPRPRYIEITG